MNHHSHLLSKQIKIALVAAVLTGATSALVPVTTFAKTVQGGDAAGLFWPVGTFDVMESNGSSVAEILDVTTNGKQLVYTDADNGEIGFVDISDPARPKGEGTVDVGGDPTSLVVLDPLVLVGVNTSESFTNPSGKLVVIHRNTRKIVAEHELGGQPDSLALAPDRKRLAIVIENERDEDLDDGLIPQNSTGKLLIVDLRGAAKKWKIMEADLSPVADNAFAGSDLEPEYVDINSHNLAVVSFQENNHLAIIDLVSGETLNEFPAGSAFLKNVDSNEDGLITLDTDLTKRREPDAVTWIDHDSFATANEGDYEEGEQGGSRGFTIFNKDGSIEYESGSSFEHWLAAVGHYNEDRSENKGCEPESVDADTFGGRSLLFVASERCNAVGVYDVSSGQPLPLQVLPTGIRPEGLKAMPKRNLFAASTESDEAKAGIPTMINLYRAEAGPALYPMIMSDDDGSGNNLPITWVALSGLVGDPDDADTLYAVSDSFLSEGFIYTVDVSGHPAMITDKLQVTGASKKLDLEGIAVGPDGHFWLGSEGNGGSRPNLIVKTDAGGVVVQEIPLPAGLTPQRNNGIEGIAVTGEAGFELVYVAIQRAWFDGIDSNGVNTKIGRYDIANDEWTFVHYPLELEGAGDWIGLSELTLLPNGHFAVIERDKGWGPTTGFNAELKAIYGVDLATAEFRAFDDAGGLVTINKTLLRDMLPDLAAVSIWTAEKLEGFAVAKDGQVYAVTDNDGVDDATGETLFFGLGDWQQALNP